MPCAMLMMSSTPKISVSPIAISAYTPPTSTPSTIARTSWCPISAPCRSVEWSAWPVGLGVEDRDRPGRSLREHLGVVATLPLEHEHHRLDVHPQRVELHRALDAAQRHPAVQVLDDLRLVGAAGGLHRLRRDLAHAVAFGHVGVDLRRAPAVLGDVLLDHALALRVVVAAEPAVGSHDPGGVVLPDRLEERGALVRAGRGGKDLGVVVLL